MPKNTTRGFAAAAEFAARCQRAALVPPIITLI
jgi:hypothetical protein